MYLFPTSESQKRALPDLRCFLRHLETYLLTLCLRMKIIAEEFIGYVITFCSEQSRKHDKNKDVCKNYRKLFV